MTTTLRRAQLIDGNAVVWTDTGMILNGVEFIHEPTPDEAPAQHWTTR